jgi:hypothetical protein
MTETKQLPLSERRLPASIGLGGSDLKPNRGFDFRPRLLPPEKARFRPEPVWLQVMARSQQVPDARLVNRLRRTQDQ